MPLQRQVSALELLGRAVGGPSDPGPSDPAKLMLHLSREHAFAAQLRRDRSYALLITALATLAAVIGAFDVIVAITH